MRTHNSKHDVTETLRKAAVLAETYDMGDVPTEFRDAMSFVENELQEESADE